VKRRMGVRVWVSMRGSLEVGGWGLGMKVRVKRDWQSWSFLSLEGGTAGRRDAHTAEDHPHTVGNLDVHYLKDTRTITKGERARRSHTDPTHAEACLSREL